MKRIIYLLLAIILIFTFSACTGGDAKYQEAVITEEKGYNRKPPQDIPREEVVFVTVSPASDDDCKDKKCYNTLNDKQKSHYRYMKTMVEEFVEGFVSLGYYYNDLYKDISVSFHALMNDYPEYYWMPSSYYISTAEEKGSISFKRGYTDDKLGVQIELNITGDFSDVSDIKDLCRTNLSAYQVPTRINLLDEIPKNGSGKIIRR